MLLFLVLQALAVFLLVGRLRRLAFLIPTVGRTIACAHLAQRLGLARLFRTVTLSLLADAPPLLGARANPILLAPPRPEPSFDGAPLEGARGRGPLFERPSRSERREFGSAPRAPGRGVPEGGRQPIQSDGVLS